MVYVEKVMISFLFFGDSSWRTRYSSWSNARKKRVRQKMYCPTKIILSSWWRQIRTSVAAPRTAVSWPWQHRAFRMDELKKVHACICANLVPSACGIPWVLSMQKPVSYKNGMCWIVFGFGFPWCIAAKECEAEKRSCEQTLEVWQYCWGTEHTDLPKRGWALIVYRKSMLSP